MSKMRKDMVRWQLLSMPTHVALSRWQLLSMPTHVVLSGRYFKVGRAFPNLIFMKLGLEEGEGSCGVRGRRRKLGEREGFI